MLFPKFSLTPATPATLATLCPVLAKNTQTVATVATVATPTDEYSTPKPDDRNTPSVATVATVAGIEGKNIAPKPEVKGTVPAVPATPATPATPSDWRPEFKAWLEGDSLRTTGVCDDLAGEIVKLTADDLPLQKKLLTTYCGVFKNPCWQSLADRFITRAAEIFDKEGVDHRTAMYRAAEEMHLLAFEKELDIKFHPPVEQDTPPF